MIQLVQAEPVRTESITTRPSALKAVPLWQVAVLVALGIWLYGSTLIHLVSQWRNDPNFSHGFFVPLFSAFVLWQERDRLARILPCPSWSGAIVLLAGLAILIVGRLGAAIPAIVLNQITFPLQLLASRVAAEVLPLLGVPVLREGNVMNLAAMPLEVAVACSGIRSLMSLVTLAIIYGYLLEKRIWVRCFLALAAVPITVAANDVRIVGTGLLVQYWDPEAAEGYFHASWGLIIFVISLLMLYGLHALLRLLFPEEGRKA